MAVPAPPAQVASVQPESFQAPASQEQLPLDAAGGGPVRNQQAQEGDLLAEHTGRVFELEKLKANQVSANERVTAMNQLATKHLYGDNQTPGYLSLQGMDAVHGLKPMLETSDDQMQDILKSSPNPDVQRLVERGYNEIRDSVVKQGADHMMREQDTYAQNTQNALLDSYTTNASLAVSTPHAQEEIERAANSGIQAIKMDAVTRTGDIRIDPKTNQEMYGSDGMPLHGAITDSKIDAFKEKLGLSVLHTASAQENPDFAKDFLDSHQDWFNKTPGLLESATKDVMTDWTGHQAVIKANDFIQSAVSQPGMSMAQMESFAREKTLKLSTDYGMQKKTDEAIKNYFSMQKQQQDAQQKAQNYDAYAYIDQYHRMPPAYMVNGMNEARLAAYQANGQPKTSEFNTVHALKSMAFSPDPKVQEDFVDEDLTQYKSMLSKGDYSTIENWQNRMKNGPSSPGMPGQNVIPEASAWRVQTEVGREAMLHMGWDPNAATFAASGPFWNRQQKITREQDFNQELDRRSSDWQGQHPGKPFTRDVVEGITRDMMLEHVTGQMQNQFTWKGLPTADGVKEIPSTALPHVDQALRGAKQPVNDMNRLRLYNEMVAGSYAR